MVTNLIHRVGQKRKSYFTNKMDHFDVRLYGTPFCVIVYDSCKLFENDSVFDPPDVYKA